MLYCSYNIISNIMRSKNIVQILLRARSSAGSRPTLLPGSETRTLLFPDSTHIVVSHNQCIDCQSEKLLLYPMAPISLVSTGQGKESEIKSLTTYSNKNMFLNLQLIYGSLPVHDYRCLILL